MTVAAACVVFLGPPGVGKGTQAVRAAEALGIPQISTGNLFREARADDSPLGRQVREFMDAGRLVPDEVVIVVVRERIARPDCDRGFILDGFPRTVAQAEALDQMLSAQGRAVRSVVALDAPAPTILQRLGGRRTCPRCDASFHVTGNPPRVAGVCDHCGAELITRPDDRPEAVQTRLEVYRAQTAALVDHYRAAGLLRAIDADGNVEEVATRVASALA